MARECIIAYIDGVAPLLLKLESSGCLGVTRLAGTLFGVSENPDRIPEHVGEKKADTFSSSTQMTLKETKNLLKTVQASKVMNPFTRALVPPFIGI
jgi:hypothetical protein